MAKTIPSAEAVGTAAVRPVTQSGETIVIQPPNDPEFKDLSDDELNKKLFDLRSEKDRIRERLLAAVAEYDWRRAKR